MSFFGAKDSVDFVEDPIEELGNKLDILINEVVEQRELLGSKGMIRDGLGNGSKAGVTSRGQLIVAPLAFSKMYSATATLDNTPVTVIVPKTGKQFIITDVILYANKNVGVNDATVSIFESDGPNSSTVVVSIFNQEMVKQTTLSLSGLNIIVSEGTWVNLQTDDDDIFINLGGYYVGADTGV